MNKEILERLSKEALKELHTDKEGALLLTPVFEKFSELLEKEFEAKHFSEGYLRGQSDGIKDTVQVCMDVFSRDLPDPTKPDYKLGTLEEVVNRVCNVAEHFGVEK